MCNKCIRIPNAIIAVDINSCCFYCGEPVPKFNSWNEEELNTLDEKFDALCEFLNVEFVTEKISDGSELGDREKFYCRKKK
jgi:hypothetical protein